MLLSERSAGMKKGPFRAEEDGMMLSFKAEWEREGKGQGLWSALAKKMCRPADTIRKRGISKFSKRLSSISTGSQIAPSVMRVYCCTYSNVMRMLIVLLTIDPTHQQYLATRLTICNSSYSMHVLVNHGS